MKETKKEIFNLTPQGIEKRSNLEKQHADELKEIFFKALDKIKNTEEADGWQRFVIFSQNSEIFEGLPAAMRAETQYYLRNHPNIISQISHKENKNILNKPHVYKWVDAEEKKNLGCKSIYFREMNEEISEKIFSAVGSFPFYVDVCNAFEYLLSGKKAGEWQEISLFYFSSMSGSPIENTIWALNFLLKAKLIVIAYVPLEGQKNRINLYFHVTRTQEEYKKAMAGEGINARQILTAEDAIDFPIKFNSKKYFFDVVGISLESLEPPQIIGIENIFEEKTFTPKPKVKENAEEIKPVAKKRFKKESVKENNKKIAEEKNEPTEQRKKIPEPELKKPELKPEPVESKIEPVAAPQNLFPAANYVAVSPVNVPEFSQAVDEIKKCMLSFTDIANSMFKNDTQRNDIMSGLIKMNDKLQEENGNLVSQLNAMKKIISKMDREKNYYIKRVQDALNMMMGQIATETDIFTKTPRHQMDDRRIMAHKADIIKIAVQTANEVQNIFDTNNQQNQNSR